MLASLRRLGFAQSVADEAVSDPANLDRCSPKAQYAVKTATSPGRGMRRLAQGAKQVRARRMLEKWPLKNERMRLTWPED
jgi:hypothetical protein